jgi:hypothetical protein
MSIYTHYTLYYSLRNLYYLYGTTNRTRCFKPQLSSGPFVQFPRPEHTLQTSAEVHTLNRHARSHGYNRILPRIRDGLYTWQHGFQSHTLRHREENIIAEIRTDYYVKAVDSTSGVYLLSVIRHKKREMVCAARCGVLLLFMSMICTDYLCS